MSSVSLLIFAAAAVVAVSGSAVYPPVHIAPASSQYHTQDEWGQYAYGYSGGPSAKHEQRTADGVTRGGYSYVDANGIVQSVSYVSDPANGFRAAGTNFPVDTAAAAPAVVHQPVPIVHHQPVPVVHDVPVSVHPWPAAAEPALLPTVVEARHLHAVPAPHLVKLAKPLTPAGTANLHYPEHAVYLAHRKKRSASHYPCPQVPGYAAPAPPAPVLHHYGATSYSSYVRHDAPPAPVAPAVPVVPVAEPEPVEVTVVDAASHVRSDSHVSTSSSHVAVAPAPQVYTSSHVVVAPAPQLYAAPAPQLYAAPVPQVYTVPHAFAAPAPQLYAARHVAVAPVPQVYAAPHVAVAPAPQVYAAQHVAIAPVKTQFHAQDEHGQYTYGYTDGASAKTETRYADGMTKGSYSYVDGNGEVQAVHYTAGADGFKAAGTNIPVHHV